jgi:hypothetical protein
MSIKLLDPNDLSTEDLVIRTVYGEARGESYLGQLAVEEVIYNRANNPRWWGSNLREVILKPFQFSCWLENDVNRQILLHPKLHENAHYLNIKDLIEAYGFRQRYGISITDNCDHYLVSAIAHKVSWAPKASEVMSIGAHSFYRLELPSLVNVKVSEYKHQKMLPIYEGPCEGEGYVIEASKEEEHGPDGRGSDDPSA